jgi:hypothetical protein
MVIEQLNVCCVFFCRLFSGTRNGAVFPCECLQCIHRCTVGCESFFFQVSLQLQVDGYNQNVNMIINSNIFAGCSAEQGMEQCSLVNVYSAFTDALWVVSRFSFKFLYSYKLMDITRMLI